MKKQTVSEAFESLRAALREEVRGDAVVEFMETEKFDDAVFNYLREHMGISFNIGEGGDFLATMETPSREILLTSGVCENLSELAAVAGYEFEDEDFFIAEKAFRKLHEESAKWLQVLVAERLKRAADLV